MTKTIIAYPARQKVVKEEPKFFDGAKIVPYGSAVLIFLGVSRLIFYYEYFGVNILSYLEFSEIITSFLSFVVIAVMGIMGILPQYFSPNIFHEWEQSGSWWGKWSRYIVTGALIGLLLTYGIVHRSSAIIVFCAVLILAVIVMRFAFRSFFSHSKLFVRQIGFSLMLLALAELFVFSASIFEYHDTRHNKRFYGTKIVFNKDTFLKDSSHSFVSDSSNYFSGKTNNYLFIFHEKENVTSIYPMSSVVEMDIKPREANWLIHFINTY